jgi:hypothetical protein
VTVCKSWERKGRGGLNQSTHLHVLRALREEDLCEEEVIILELEVNSGLLEFTVRYD